LLPSAPYWYTLRGRLAIASERILTQAYTAVTCMDVRSLTFLPAAVPPNKKGQWTER